MEKIDYAALVERLRKVKRAIGAEYGLISYPSENTHPTCADAADALERLTQPVGVDPVLQVWIEGNPGVWEDCSDWAYQQAADDDRRTLYSADAVARLWNTECDEMREDNKRLAAELAAALEWNERYAIELRELRAQDPVAFMFKIKTGGTRRPVLSEFAAIDYVETGNDEVIGKAPLFARPVPDAGKTIAVGKIILGATDGAEVDDWDVEWDQKAIDSINESRPANVNELPLFLATVK